MDEFRESYEICCKNLNLLMKDKPQSSREHNQAKKKAAEFYWAKKKSFYHFPSASSSDLQHSIRPHHHITKKKNEIHSSSRSIHERVYFLVFIVFRRQFFSPSSFVYRQTAAAGAEVKPRKFPKDSFSTVQLLFCSCFFFFGSKIDFPHIIKNERSVRGCEKAYCEKYLSHLLPQFFTTFITCSTIQYSTRSLSAISPNTLLD